MLSSNIALVGIVKVIDVAGVEMVDNATFKGSALADASCDAATESTASAKADPTSSIVVVNAAPHRVAEIHAPQAGSLK